MNYCSSAQYKYFMKKVNQWEKKEINKGLILIKFYLSIDKDTQVKRFNFRRNHMLKYWKLSENDVESLTKWDKYTYYKNKMFEKTSTEISPWIIINAKNKLTARLNAIRFMLENINYEGKKKLKSSSWNIDKKNQKIKISGIIFDNLNDDQYNFLNYVKQII